MKNEDKSTKLDNSDKKLIISDVMCSFIDRYKKIADSKWFKKIYENKTLGDIINYT